MRLSREEALSLLSKWQTESIPVSGSMMLSGVYFSFSGFISEINSHAFKIARFDGSGEAAKLHFGIIIQFMTVATYEYADSREATEDERDELSKVIASRLLLTFQSSGHCSIFERTH